MFRQGVRNPLAQNYGRKVIIWAPNPSPAISCLLGLLRRQARARSFLWSLLPSLRLCTLLWQANWPAPGRIKLRLAIFLKEKNLYMETVDVFHQAPYWCLFLIFSNLISRFYKFFDCFCLIFGAFSWCFWRNRPLFPPFLTHGHNYPRGPL